MKSKVDEVEIISHVARLARLTQRLMYGVVKKPDGEQIFISYRREDAGYAGRIYDWLQKSFPKGRLFMDVDAVDLGTDFMKRINNALNSAEILIVLIGPRWLGNDNSGTSRLEDADDIVRHEISVGLQRNIFILPILLGKATMPSHKILPADLIDFSRRNALEISDLSWTEGANQLINTLKKVLGEPMDSSDGISTERLLARILMAVGEFVEDPDPESEAGDFLIVGAGKGKNEKPNCGIEVYRNKETAWCELASEVFTKNKIDITNQLLRLKENGWIPPSEGPYEKSLFKGMKLTRWWRKLDSQTMAGDFDDVSDAIINTFMDVYKVLPQGVAMGWSSTPVLHPLDTSEKNEEIGMEIRAKSPMWS